MRHAPITLPAPHGGTLVDLLADAARAAALKAESPAWPSCQLSFGQMADLDLLVSGAFSPLRGFMNRPEYESVCREGRLTSGAAWTMPVVLDVGSELARHIERQPTLTLRDPEGVMLAVLHVETLWAPDRDREAQSVFGTSAPDHPGVARMRGRAAHLVGGRVEAVQQPVWHDFRGLRRRASDLRADFIRRGWTRVIAVQPPDPLSRADRASLLATAEDLGAGLLIHASIRPGPPDAVEHSRIRGLQAACEGLGPDTVAFGVWPLAPQGAGWRQTVTRAIVERNFGCTHAIAESEADEPDAETDARVRALAADLGITMVPHRPFVYVSELDSYLGEREVPTGLTGRRLSRTELKEHLEQGKPLPVWFAAPGVVRELTWRHPPRSRQGFTVFFTGLSGSGKSTLANRLLVCLLERGGRRVTLLDGDLVRRHLSSELGFSKDHRNLNIRRIGFVAAEITRHGGVAICAPIAPYTAVRDEVRRMVSAEGGFILVHVATALEVCEQRDRKGLYAKARAGQIPEFTGISDVYEPPLDADIVIDTSDLTPEAGVDVILRHLERVGYLSPEASQVAAVAGEETVE